MRKIRPHRSQLSIFAEDKLTWFDVEAYLGRIGIDKAERPALPFFRRLHRQHLYHVPFENLDIHWGREILLDLPKLYQKVVIGGRGGFCYELNSLFCTLLNKLGFPAYIISAQILRDDSTLTPEFEHMAVLVEINREVWLADVGFGKGFLSPIKISKGEAQVDFNKFFRIIRSEEHGWCLQESDDGQHFASRYFFTLKKRTLIEFIGRCQYQQQDPLSHFKKQKLITIPTPEGRITLTDRQLIVLKRGERMENHVLDEGDFNNKLREYFGVSRPTN